MAVKTIIIICVGFVAIIAAIMSLAGKCSQDEEKRAKEDGMEKKEVSKLLGLKELASEKREVVYNGETFPAYKFQEDVCLVVAKISSGIDPSIACEPDEKYFLAVPDIGSDGMVDNWKYFVSSDHWGEVPTRIYEDTDDGLLELVHEENKERFVMLKIIMEHIITSVTEHAEKRCSK